jgi:hypothetical protein
MLNTNGYETFIDGKGQVGLGRNRGYSVCILSPFNNTVEIRRKLRSMNLCKYSCLSTLEGTGSFPEGIVET